MPKITRLGGPSVAGAVSSAPAGRPAGEHGPELVDLPPGAVIHERINVTPLDRDPVNDPEYIDGMPVPDPEGGDDVSPGSSSSTSPERTQTLPESKPAGRRKRAHGTASRSKRDRTGNSTAGSTATPGRNRGDGDAPRR